LVITLVSNIYHKAESITSIS